MPRTMHGDEPAAFRAVVTTRTDYSPEYRSRYDVPESRESVEYFGPYGTIGAARAAITREKRYAGTMWAGFRTVTGHVERSSQEWVRVEDA